MPSLDRALVLNLGYAASLATLAGLAWMGPTYPFAPSLFGGAVTMPTLDPLGGSSVHGLACTWLPATGLALASILRLRASGVRGASSAMPFAFLAVAVSFALAAWVLSPGSVASLLASFSRTTVVLFLGLFSVGVGCVPADAEESGDVATVGPTVLHVPRAANRDEPEAIALAA